MEFVELNVNPKGRKTSDCVIRAIAKAEGKDWLEVFDSLVKIARRKFTVPTDKVAYEDYLLHYPTVEVFRYRNNVKKRLLVRQVADMPGTYLVRIANHLTVVEDGVLYDLMDCGCRSSYKIWRLR